MDLLFCSRDIGLLPPLLLIDLGVTVTVAGSSSSSPNGLLLLLLLGLLVCMLLVDLLLLAVAVLVVGVAVVKSSSSPNGFELTAATLTFVLPPATVVAAAVAVAAVGLPTAFSCGLLTSTLVVAVVLWSGLIAASIRVPGCSQTVSSVSTLK